ncbi:MAG: hypothetical protein IPI41_16900 [Flavobacteriales bacterium]|nr:hypothetical protein [Flavobacteriales bacterium]
MTHRPFDPFLTQPITGADNFQLLLDRHMRKQGQQGNVVRLELRLAPSADLEQLRGHVQRNGIFMLVRRIRLARPIARAPYWYQDKGADLPGGVEVRTAMDRADFEAVVLNRDLSLATGAAFIDLVAFNDGSKSLVISAHHALFDQRGMMNLARVLDPEGPGMGGEALFPEPSPGALAQALEACRAGDVLYARFAVLVPRAAVGQGPTPAERDAHARAPFLRERYADRGSTGLGARRTAGPFALPFGGDDHGIAYCVHAAS